MKLTPLLRATLFAFALTLLPAAADVTGDNGYLPTSYFTDPSANNITGFDWNSSNLYYETGDAYYDFTGFYQANVTNQTANNLSTYLTSAEYSGASVVSIGSNVYFNDGNNDLYLYNPAASNTSSNPALLAGTASSGTSYNYAVFGNSGLLYQVQSDSGNNQITVSTLGTDGTLTSTPKVIEQDGAAQGPLVFDSAGDLFYAPGDYDQSIYMWTSAQVNTASTGGTLLTPANATETINYSTTYGTYAGATSLAIDNGDLLVTLTNFGGPSALISYNLSNLSQSNLMATDDGTGGNFLGTIQLNNGNLFVADGSQILEIVPEPSTYLLLALGLAGLVYYRARRTGRSA